jgi:two-component system cell cycle sensor histidine kinase/response regulator CckA
MERAGVEQWKAREVARLLALVESERRYYQEIVASIPVGLLVLSPDLAIVSSNREVRKIFGLRAGDSLRSRPDALLPAWVLDRARQALETGVSESGLLAETDLNGGRRLRIGILPLRNWDDETGQEALLTLEDLTGFDPPSEPTAAVPVELIENVDAMLWIVEAPSMNLVYLNPRGAEMLGFPPAHWLNAPDFWHARIHAPDRDRILDAYRQALENPAANGGEVHCEYRAATESGRLLWLRESARIVSEDGQPRHIVGLASDITQRRELEDQLVQSHRVEAASKLAARLAHDLNNLLMIVTGYGEELLAGIPESSPLRADVREIVAATGRLSDLAGHLLAFTRRQALPPSAVELGSALRNLQSAWREVEFVLPVEPIVVRAEPGQLAESIAALLRHAGGRVAVSVSTLRITEDLRRPNETLPPGDYGVIQIEHSGTPPDDRSLFESFLPPKEGASDTGPALARAYGILRQWGGGISANGPTLRIFLPLVESAAGPSPAPAPIPAAEPKPSTVLVVEDESGIRSLVHKFLSRQGYSVIEAPTGGAALEICREHLGRIDLVITDVMMPEMGGRQLAAQLQEQRPDLKILYISGYSDDPTVYTESLPPNSAFLQKPFTLGSLLTKVKEVLV